MSEHDDYIYRLNDSVAKAHDASKILGNQLYQDAWKLLEDALYDAFVDADPRNVKELQEIRMMVSATKNVRNFFEGLVDNGKAARADLLDLEDRMKDENTIN